MGKLDKHIIFSIVSSTFVVLLALQSIDLFVQVIAATDDVGERNYTIFTLIQYVLGYSSLKLIQFFPIALLIGSLMGLGKVAAANELTVMQVSGVSKLRIGIVGFAVAFIVGIIALLFNESIAVKAHENAINMRLEALGLPSNKYGGNGVWIHSENSFVNVRGVLPNGRLSNVSIYTLDDDMQLRDIKVAKSVEAGHKNWTLFSVSEKNILDSQISTQKYSTGYWKNNLEGDVTKLLFSEPENLSIKDLYLYLQYQKANKIKSTNYALVFWQRLFVPLTTGVMFLLALPFVFGSQRNNMQGKKLFLGILLGLSYFVVSTSISNIILLTGVPVILGALLPIILCVMISFLLLQYRN